VEVTINRDSVAAHERTLEVDSRRKFVHFLQELRKTYLAEVHGGRATWVVRDERRGRALAVVAQQWDEPECFVDPFSEVAAVSGRFHFEYVTQEDPGTVADRVRPRP
jgi:hypothetical protein